MLDVAEFSHVMSKRVFGIKDFKAEFAGVLDEYQAITGVKYDSPNPIWHHRLAIYGPPCRQCGKPLRTPKAKHCGACMTPVATAV